MRALFIQHDHASPAGPIAERFEQRGYTIDYFQVVPEDRYESPNVTVEFPDFSQYDVIVPMGASWGVWDEATIGNWLVPELAAVRAAHERGQAIMGICFGGQLMARALGLKVAAEGVETEEQRARLLQIGCPTIQGFLYCRAVPADEIDRMLELRQAVAA